MTELEKDLEEPKQKKKESQVRAEKKYLEKFDELKIRVPAGKKEMIKERAEELGLSVNAYLQKLITEDLEDIITLQRYYEEQRKIEQERQDRIDSENDIPY